MLFVSFEITCMVMKSAYGHFDREFGNKFTASGVFAEPSNQSELPRSPIDSVVLLASPCSQISPLQLKDLHRIIVTVSLVAVDIFKRR